MIYVDETGFPVDGDQHWVWTFVTDNEVLYNIDGSRGSQVLEEVLGDAFAEDSTLGCDGWPAYRSYHTKLQRCWAHLLREEANYNMYLLGWRDRPDPDAFTLPSSAASRKY